MRTNTKSKTNKRTVIGVKPRYQKQKQQKQQKQELVKFLLTQIRAIKAKKAAKRERTESNVSTARKTIVMAHRGGNFGPDNSMSNFRAAVENKVEGIEFDVWLSKDNVPMVLHGGNDGQLAKYGHADQLIFEWTAAELQTLDIGGGETIPKFEELLNLIHEAPQMLINVEMKAPLSEEMQKHYNYEAASQIVNEAITRHGIEDRTIISTFDKKMANLMETAPNRKFKVIQLLNYDGPEQDGYETSTGMTGINVDYHHLEQKVIEKTQEDGKVIGVWYWNANQGGPTTENIDVYEHVFGRTGNIVDYFYSDNPLEAMRVRDMIQNT